MRQKGDPLFKEILDRVRWGGCGPEDLKVLESLKETQFPEGIKPTRLYSKNVSVDAINLSELEELNKPIEEFVTFMPTDMAKKWASTNRIPEKVRLCVGAQVMCTKNIPELGLANGSRGVIQSVTSSGILFKKMSGATVAVPMVDYDINEYNSIRYLPIKLAWAITIHSAQGMTIDALEVDLGRDIFAFGQAYTGLSRATSLSSVRIANVLPSSFVTSPIVKEVFA
jgi:ATP-dependent DNA helicase PIF1